MTPAEACEAALARREILAYEVLEEPFDLIKVFVADLDRFDADAFPCPVIAVGRAQFRALVCSPRR